MKIGIITLPLLNNYGGILQNYALQNILTQQGHTPKTVNIGKYTSCRWLYDYIKCFALRLLGRKYPFPLSPNAQTRKYIKLLKFINQYIQTTDRTVWYKDSVLKNHKFEALIVGSDQIWRPLYNRKIEDAFLKFAQTYKCKKIVYAASFGSDKWEYTNMQTEQCKFLIQQFSAISVREKKGIDFCEKYLNTKAINSLDPTLLLTRTEYIKLCNTIPIKDTNSIFVYMLDMTSEKMNFVQKLGALLTLDIIVMGADKYINPDDSIEKWIASFRDARYIITDSFHGTIFSIIFNKPFISIANVERGESRFYSLLSQLGLIQHLISPECIDSVDFSTLFSSVDWEVINQRVANLRKQSINFIHDNLNH